MRLLSISGLALAGLVSQQQAQAGFVTVSASQGGSALAGQTYANLDGRTLGSMTQTGNSGLTIAFTGGGAFVQGSVTNQYVAPTISGNNNMFFEPNSTPGPDTTTYASTGIGSATLTFASGPSTYLGLLWGSIDSYNSLKFNFTDGTSQTISGATIAASLNMASPGTAYVNFVGSAFSSVVASSTNNSFEFDNVAFNSVPEPSSMAMCALAGGISLGAARARRRRPTA